MKIADFFKSKKFDYEKVNQVKTVSHTPDTYFTAEQQKIIRDIIDEYFQCINSQYDENKEVEQ